MRRLQASLLAPVAAVLLSCGPAAADSNGIFLSILPPGNNGYMNTGQAIDYLDDGTLPANFDNQRLLYAAVTYAQPGILTEDLENYFKPSPIAPSGNPASFPKPPIDGLVITRDNFGVPHIQAKSRDDAMYGIGWSSAADRLFSMDVARHAGRGRMSELVGYDPDLVAQDREVYEFAGYDEADLQAQYDDITANYGGTGKLADKDITAFVNGINTFIVFVNNGSIAPPVEYGALGQLPIKPFKKTDVVAVATFLEFLFGAGGGAEYNNADLLGKLQGDLGATTGQNLWNDLRSAEEPDAPVTTELSFPYQIQGPVDPAAVAKPDADSVVFDEVVEMTGPIPSAAMSMVGITPLVRRANQPSMSNFLAIAGAKTGDGNPILVGGPQIGYQIPELVYEFSVHAAGLHTRGVAPIGSPYVVLGRGENFAFTATAGGSDNTDVRAELLCEPDSSPATTASMHYKFNGQCIAIEERIDTWCAGGGQADPSFCTNNPDNVTATVQRTVHGNVFGRATVGGKPVALVRQRASFRKEGQNALAFQKINKGTPTPKTFLKSISKAPGSFNWMYVNEKDMFYFHSGLFPIRAAGVDQDMPSWGTGEWEWQGWVPVKEHPQETNPAKGYATSWNNKPAKDWRASDSNYEYTSVYRNDMLNKLLEAKLIAGPLTAGDMVEVMSNAAFTDLRGQEVLPLALLLIDTEPGLETVLATLQSWVTAGTMRRDRDDDGAYDNAAAVAIMDAWFTKMIHAVFDPQLANYYSDIPVGFDNKPSKIGSAYQGGYYGYMKKVLKQALGQPVTQSYSVLHCADGTRAGCRAAMVSSLEDAVDELTTRFASSTPADWTVNPSDEDIEFRPFGLAKTRPMPWMNRPTYQQVVQVSARK